MNWDVLKNKEQRNALLRVAAVVALFIVMVALAIYIKGIGYKILFGVLAAIIAAFLAKIFISLKRKKFYIQGQCIAVNPPKGKFKKYEVYIKIGKMTKKLYSPTQINMKKGKMYGVYFEEKSNDIIKFEELGVNIQRPKK